MDPDAFRLRIPERVAEENEAPWSATASSSRRGRQSSELRASYESAGSAAGSKSPVSVRSDESLPTSARLRQAGMVVYPHPMTPPLPSPHDPNDDVEEAAVRQPAAPAALSPAAPSAAPSPAPPPSAQAAPSPAPAPPALSLETEEAMRAVAMEIVHGALERACSSVSTPSASMMTSTDDAEAAPRAISPITPPVLSLAGLTSPSAEEIVAATRIGAHARGRSTRRRAQQGTPSALIAAGDSLASAGSSRFMPRGASLTGGAVVPPFGGGTIAATSPCTGSSNGATAGRPSSRTSPFHPQGIDSPPDAPPADTKQRPSSARVSKPEAAALLQRAMRASTTPRAKSARDANTSRGLMSKGGHNISTGGSKSARAGGRFSLHTPPASARSPSGKAGAGQSGASSARSEPRRQVEAHYILQHDGASGMASVSPLSSPLRSTRLSELADEVVYVPPGELYRLRNEYETRLAKERGAAERAAEELEAERLHKGELAHQQAMVETTQMLTKMRKVQRRQLGMHTKMHEAHEVEKAQSAVREANKERAARDAMRRARAEAKASVEAQASAKLQLAESRQLERHRVEEERLQTRWRKRVNEADEQRKLERERAENLERELSAARAETSAHRLEAERLRRESRDALRQAAARAASERGAAVAYEQHRAEQQRQTLLLNEASRADVHRSKAAKAEQIAHLASEALRVAESAKEKANTQWEEAEAQRAEHEMEAVEARRLQIEAGEERAQAELLAEAAAAQMIEAQQLAEAHQVALEESRAQAAVEMEELQRQLAEALASAEASANALAAATDSPEGALDYEATPEGSQRASFTQGSQRGGGGSFTQGGFNQETPQRMSRDSRTSRESRMSRESVSSIPHSRADSVDGDASQHDSQLLAQLQERLQASEAERETLATAVATSGAEKLASLRRLREAYRTRIHTRPLAPPAVQHALHIAASPVDDSHLVRHASGDDVPSLVSWAHVGVVCALVIPATAATTFGLGADGADAEPLIVHADSRSGKNPFEKVRGGPPTSPGRSPSTRSGSPRGRGAPSADPAVVDGVVVVAAAVAIPAGAQGDWIVKYVWDPEQATGAAQGTNASTPTATPTAAPGVDALDAAPAAAPSSAPVAAPTVAAGPTDPTIDPSQFGERLVTIASRDGLVIARGRIDLQPRPAGVGPSVRYNFRVAKAAAMRLQAVLRGRGERRRHEQRAASSLHQLLDAVATPGRVSAPTALAPIAEVRSRSPSPPHSPTVIKSPTGRTSPTTAANKPNKVPVPALPVGDAPLPKGKRR